MICSAYIVCIIPRICICHKCLTSTFISYAIEGTRFTVHSHAQEQCAKLCIPQSKNSRDFLQYLCYLALVIRLTFKFYCVAMLGTKSICVSIEKITRRSLHQFLLSRFTPSKMNGFNLIWTQLSNDFNGNGFCSKKQCKFCGDGKGVQTCLLLFPALYARCRQTGTHMNEVGVWRCVKNVIWQ